MWVCDFWAFSIRESPLQIPPAFLQTRQLRPCLLNSGAVMP
ncbi:hypothetical protein SLEP1_g42338 [Rubroshorea leprosula]|uniref:Uncharacterized protein n=1 Tax=Rubroshorea leprosula TaxID=152421 RepID=A0AAV5L9H4_9ROSI|nr:hypothetical protein SLEP1_g42338 [Rubroshorea leprosula]